MVWPLSRTAGSRVVWVVLRVGIVKRDVRLSEYDFNTLFNGEIGVPLWKRLIISGTMASEACRQEGMKIQLQQHSHSNHWSFTQGLPIEIETWRMKIGTIGRVLAAEPWMMGPEVIEQSRCVPHNVHTTMCTV